MDDRFWQVTMIVVQALLALMGFIGAFLIHRLTRSIDNLIAADIAFNDKLTLYREDMLRNYVRNEQLEPIKKDIIGRVDRMELSFKEALMAHEHRELQIYQMRGKQDG